METASTAPPSVRIVDLDAGLRHRVGALAILVLLIFGAAHASPAAAAASKRPLLPLSEVRHIAWEIRQDYIEVWEVNWRGVDNAKTSCRRVLRNVVDCKTSMLFWNGVEGCVEAAGAPADSRCPPGSRYDSWWEGERVSWKMRWRREPVPRVGYKTAAYFPADRYASIAPKDKRFGGLALRRTPASGE